MDRKEMLIENLNAGDVNVRLESLRELKKLVDSGAIEKPVTGNDVNNHIHTIYSFSPYSPAKAVWMAYQAGLKTAGIIDHDSISGAREFIEAGKIIGMMTTIGVECRVKMSSTPLNGKRINNTDQDSIAYTTVHGIPHTQIDIVKEFFKPFSAFRNQRDRKMVDNINTVMHPYGISLDFEKDVVPLSKTAEGGSITERHILFALSRKMISKLGKGAAIVNFLENNMKITISSKIRAMLEDVGNEVYDYDLLGILKSDLIEKIYIPATDECPDVREIVAFSKKIGAISAYPYLGDVGDSVTGDKKTQKFEDGYLDELFSVIRELGYNAVTYMPSRNTMAQLVRLKKLCEDNKFFQISGEDINSPRQSFICMAQRDPLFSNLYDATLALIGHEIAATKNLEDAMFSDKTVKNFPDLDLRIEHYKEIAEKS
ncbi:MAG: PHP domain-containing protein [Clostridiales bacterium]|jgi:hypothetical protein|nr:PHP domain-containing protein [Clostridiales bacterium]